MSKLTNYDNSKALQFPPSYTLARLLAANIAEIFTVPTDENGKLAGYVTLAKTSATAVDFYAKAYNAVDATDRATDGAFTEVAANGTFATDTLWTKGVGWTIAAGVATATGAISTALVQSSANIAVALIPGYSYSVTYTTSSVSAGTITVSLGGTAGTARSTSATFVETVIAGSDGTITFNTAGFTGNIDNVSVIPWILGAGWTTASGVATAASTISTALSQTANPVYPLIQGQAYLVTYVATQSAGSVTINIGGTAGTARSSSATFTEVIIAGSTQVISFTTSGFTGTVTTLTVVPAVAVPSDVTLGTAGDLNSPGYFLNNNIFAISVVSAGTPIVTANFYK